MRHSLFKAAKSPFRVVEMALERLCGEMLYEAWLFPETEGTADHVLGHAFGGYLSGEETM